MEIPKYSCGTDDISFCLSDCNDTTCFRHPDNRIDKRWPFSGAYFKDTEYCKHCKKNKEDVIANGD